MGIDPHIGPGQPAAVDDRGMVELVGVDDGPSAANTDSTDRLAANPVGSTTAASVPFHSARASSS